MDLEQCLNNIVELSREELSIVRKRAEEKTPARDHGHDYHAMLQAADQLDHHAHLLRRLHDGEFEKGWRHDSAEDTSGS
jgi:hypothetical protein